MSTSAKPFRRDTLPSPYQPSKIVIGAIFNCVSLLFCAYGAIFVDGYSEDNNSSFRYFLIILVNIIVFNISCGITWMGAADAEKKENESIHSFCYIACSIAGAFTTGVWFISTVVIGGGKISQLARRIEPLIEVILSVASVINALSLVALLLIFCGFSMKRLFSDEKTFDNVVPVVSTAKN